MLSKPVDEIQSDSEWMDFVATHRFGQVIAPGRGRDLPAVTPLHFAFDAETHAAYFHVQRSNPLLEALAENPQAVLSVIGAYVYIPSDWNAAEGADPAWGVPTSYYAAVQLTGAATILSDGPGISDALNRMLAQFEPGSAAHAVEPDDSPYGKLLGAIRAVRLTITGVRGKFKFGGNKDVAHRLRVAEKLAGRDGILDAEAREHVLRRSSS